MRQGNDWVSTDEAKVAEERDKTRAAALATWQPKIEKLARAPGSHQHEAARDPAARRLSEITDPAAVAAIEEVLRRSKRRGGIIGR